jgi:hypothetical protein
MIWIANFWLLLAVIFLGRKSFTFGWSCSLIGSILYVIVPAFFMQPRHFDIASFNVIMTCVAGRNLWKSLTAK